jgi:predicted DNA-binding protein with PD1-like motif
MRLLATRLQEGQDLKQGIADFAKTQGVDSGVIMSAVGSLSAARLRMAGAAPDKQDVREYAGSFEIVSLTGTIASEGGIHLHISISDEDGKVVGGHLKDGCIVHTTVELAIADDRESVRFTRELDDVTGFDELKVSEVPNGD